jgi:hypothetical protein
MLGLLLIATHVLPVEEGLDPAVPGVDEGLEQGEQGPWRLGAELDFLSRYVFRGLPITEGPVLQPFLFTGYKRLTLDVFANMNLDAEDSNPGRVDEIDLDLYWTQPIGTLSATPGVSYYNYPLDEVSPQTAELFLLLSHPVGPLQLELLNTVDVLEFSGYWTASVTLWYEASITDRILLELGVSAGYSTDPNEEEDEYATLFPEVSVSVFLTENIYLRPHASLSHFLYSAFDPEEDNVFACGIAVGCAF